MKLFKRIIGGIIAIFGALATVLSVYQLFTTGSLQWLTLTVLSLGFAAAGCILILGSVKEFIEALLDVFQIVP